MVKTIDAALLPVEKELRNTTETVRRISAEICELVNKNATNASIICTVNFLKTTLERRSIILHELRKGGLSEQEAMRRIREVRHADA